MKTLFAGIAYGAGAILKVGIGGTPDWVRVRALQSDLPKIEWDRTMLALATFKEGIKSTLNSTTPVVSVLTAGLGIQPYAGGDLISAAANTHIVPVEPGFFPTQGYCGDMRAKGTGTITAWTLGNSTNRTGSFNYGVDTDRVAAGSRVMIDGVWYSIVALSNDGDAANEVTLDRAAPSGEVQKILFKADLYNAPAGVVMPAGFLIAADADVNASGERLLIEAGLFE